MPRFAISRHDPSHGGSRPLHWDLFLEDGPALLTWALAEPPASDRVIAAEALPPHRTVYLDYQGPISGDRGSVTRWDAGEFTWVRRTEDEIVVQFAGRALRGQATLTRVDPHAAVWRFFMHAGSAKPT